MWYRRCIFGFIKKAIKGVGKAIKGVVKGAGKIVKGIGKAVKGVAKGVVKLAKKAWKNKYIRAGLIIAAVATGVGAAALAGAGGTTFGAALSSGFTGGASAFGGMLKAGFVGATGAAGTTAGLLGSGGVGVSALAGPGLTTGLGGTPLAIGSASGITGTGFNLTGGALLGGGSVSTPVPPLVGPPAPVAVTGKSGFLNSVGKFVRSGVELGAKQALATAATNTLLYGKPLGPEPEELYRDGGSAVSYLSLTGYSRAPTTFNVQPSRIVDSADTIGNTYVSLLSNLNYGTGSLNYATNANYSLMKGVQIPKIQYS